MCSSKTSGIEKGAFNDMIEMRREKRWPADLKLEITSLFKQGNIKVENINAPIEIVDVSRAGIGFKTESMLPVDYYFNARLVLGKEDAMNCVIHILRQQKLESGYLYGCEIVGAASIMDYVINDYAASLE
jgi:hypothetical protein